MNSFILSAVGSHWSDLSKAFTSSLQTRRGCWFARGRRAVSIARSRTGSDELKESGGNIFLLITKPISYVATDEQGGRRKKTFLFHSGFNANILSLIRGKRVV